MTYQTPDLVIIVAILFSVLIGIIRGFIKEFVSLVTWVIAAVLAMMFSNTLAQFITFTKVPFIKTLIAFLGIFISCLFVGAVLNFIIGTFVRRTPFSIPDRILGSAFGLFRGVAVVTILVLLATLTPIPEKHWWQESYLIARIEVLSLWVKAQLPNEYAQVFAFGDETVKDAVGNGNLMEKADLFNKNSEDQLEDLSESSEIKKS